MNQETAFRLLRNMVRLRRMEEICGELYTEEKIRGFLHLYIGEEAVAAGVMDHVHHEDNVVATYREHGHALLKGIPARAILAEMFGKMDGCSKGRGGSMHLYSREHRFFGGNAIVASGVPHAVGLALAAKMQHEERLTFCFFGDGATAEGEFHEALNIAAVWKLPILFCCENNLYAMGTALHRYLSQTDLAKKASCYNVKSTTADGMNIYDVYEKSRDAILTVKSTMEPFFIEFRTYRFRPHSMFDPDLYRDKEEIKQWKKRDPIEYLKKDLLVKGLISETQIGALEKDVEKELADAVQFAEKSLWEPLQDLEKDVYCEDELSSRTPGRLI